MELGGLTGARVDQGQQPARACPRCNSNNTKFCYFNNYSLTQPRYFCKGCRRYWTHGGTLRNVPVGGSSRKSKRPRASVSSPQQASSAVEASTNNYNNNNNNNSGPIATASVMMPPPNMLPFHGGGFLSSLVVGQSMSLPAPALQVRPDFAPFGRRDLAGGWIGGDGTGAQFWTLGGNVGGAGEEGGCGSNPGDQWRNFPAVAGGGNGDN